MAADKQVVILIATGKVFQEAQFGINLYPTLPQDGTVLWFDFEGPVIGPDPIRTSNTALIGSDDLVEDETNVFIGPSTVKPADPRLAMTLPNAKLATIDAARKVSAGRILAAYPLQTQIDITRAAINPDTGVAWTGGDLTTMTTFIDDEYTDLAARITGINACANVAAVVAYDVWT